MFSNIFGQQKQNILDTFGPHKKYHLSPDPLREIAETKQDRKRELQKISSLPRRSEHIAALRKQKRKYSSIFKWYQVVVVHPEHVYT